MSGVSVAFAMVPFDTYTAEEVGDFIEAVEQGNSNIVSAARNAEYERRWEDALDLMGRNRGPHALSAWWPDLTPEEKSRLICEVWEEAEWPVAALGERRWLEMFKETGFVTTGPERPDSEALAYRGAPVDTKGRGMSWSVDRERAEWFATRWARNFDVPAAVYRATLPPRAILALVGFDDGSRHEKEFVVNPNMLRGRIEIEAKTMVEVKEGLPPRWE